MTQTDIVDEIASLLVETGKAHHQAFIETDGADPEWPLWYAEYLHDKLPPLLDASLTKAEIVHLLLDLEMHRQGLAPGAKWAPYFARVMVGRYLDLPEG